MANDNIASGIFSFRPPIFLDLVFASLLATIFTVLVPIVEWPDAMDHIGRRVANETVYPFDIFSLLPNLKYPSLNGHHDFFADHHIYKSSLNYILLNLERLPVVLFVLFGLYVLARKFTSGLLLFCPPLIFSLAAPSQEVLAILMLLIAVVVQNKSGLSAVLFSLLAIAIDRSMVPNAIFIILFSISAVVRSLVLNRWFVFGVGIIVIISSKVFSPFELFGSLGNSEVTVFHFSIADLSALAENGQNNLLALISSVMGLYGWLSIRPFPFFIYYPALAFLFFIGFLSSQSKVQSLFVALFLVSYCVLWFLPPLSQARYYPLLSIMFWAIVLAGVRFVGVNVAFFNIFVIVTTGVGLLIPF